MTPEQIYTVARTQHIAPQALDTIVAQAQAHFTGASPKPADLAAYIGALSTWAKAGIPWEVFEKLPPGTRIALDRTHNPTPPPAVHSRRPVTRPLTPAELAAHNEQAVREGWSQAEYRERARVVQQTPLPPQP